MINENNNDNNKKMVNFTERRLLPSRTVTIFKIIGLFLVGCGILETITLFQRIITSPSNSVFHVSNILQQSSLPMLLAIYYLLSFPPLLIALFGLSYTAVIVLVVEFLLPVSMLVLCQFRKKDWSFERFRWLYILAFLITIIPVIIPETTLVLFLPPLVQELEAAGTLPARQIQIVQGIWTMMTWLSTWLFSSYNLLTMKKQQNNDYYRYYLFFWVGWLLLQTSLLFIEPTYTITFSGFD